MTEMKQFVRKYYLTWLIDLANKLFDVKNLLISFYAVKNCLVLLKIFVNIPVE